MGHTFMSHTWSLITQVLATDSLPSVETQDSDTCNEENGPTKFKNQKAQWAIALWVTGLLGSH